MVFWAKLSGSGKAPQMFVVEGHGEPIWKAFAENILNVPNTEVALLSCFEKYLENDEKLQLHAAGRVEMGKPATTANNLHQWITISNRPGRKIDLDEQARIHDQTYH